MDSNWRAPEIERAILGYILSNGTMHGVYGFLQAEDFTDRKHQIIYESLATIVDKFSDKNLEISLLLQDLRTKNVLEKIGGETFVLDLVDEACLDSNLTNYIKIIIEKARLRQINLDLNEIQRKLKTPSTSVDALIDEVEAKILASIRSTEERGFINAKDLARQTIAIIEDALAGNAPNGVKSNFSDLDTITGGFQKGDLIIMAARPSMGKTALALNIAINVAKHENVAFFSVEMSSDQISKRILALEGMIESHKLREPSLMNDMDRKKLYIGEEKFAKLKLFIDDTAGIRLSELIWKAKNLHKNLPLSLIVIDYLQLITLSETSQQENRQVEVAKISRALKKLARELNLPILALAQLSRRVEQRESKIPMMSDLRESGSIEQDADLVAFIYREDYYKKESEKTNENVQKTDVIIGKHRNGATGTVSLGFNPKFGIFSDKPRKDL